MIDALSGCRLIPGQARVGGDRHRGRGDPRSAGVGPSARVVRPLPGRAPNGVPADQVSLPSKITIFRGPLTRANRTPERLAAAVTDTVYHEIAHHFGISDARLHELKTGH